MLRKTCLLWAAMAICCLLAGLSIQLQAGHTDLVNSNRTTKLFQDSDRFWHGAEASTGGATTPTITQIGRFGPAWVSSVEAAMVGDMLHTDSFTFVGANGTDFSTTTLVTAGAHLVAAALPATIVYTIPIKDSHNLRMLWLDGFETPTAVADTYTTGDAADDDVKMDLMFDFTPADEKPNYSLGQATYTVTITTNTLTATTCALTLTHTDFVLLGYTISKPVARTFYILQP